MAGHLQAVVALALQVGVNMRTTTATAFAAPMTSVGRAAPTRRFRAVPAAPVKRAAQLAFGVAGVFGAVLALVVGPQLFVVGAVSILVMTYTGGPKALRLPRVGGSLRLYLLRGRPRWEPPTAT